MNAMKSLDLERLWRWLPTFRVVAEHESVGEAARLLELSASAVSRSVRLLEAELGKELFVRVSGRLVLNDMGRQFLETVRRSIAWWTTASRWRAEVAACSDSARLAR